MKITTKRLILIAFSTILTPAVVRATNPLGSSCSSDEYCSKCNKETGEWTSVPCPTKHGSFDWSVKVGLARYSKPETLTDFAQTSYEINGNLPTFPEIYNRYFSSAPLQESQVILGISQPKLSSETFHPSCLYIQSEALFEVIKFPGEGNLPEYIHQIRTTDAFTLIDRPYGLNGFRVRVWKIDAATLNKSGTYYDPGPFLTKTPLYEATFKVPDGTIDYNTLVLTQKETTGEAGTRTTTNKVEQVLNSTDGKIATVTSFIYNGEGTSGSLLSKELLTYEYPPSNTNPKSWDYSIIREVSTAPVDENGDIGTSVILIAKSKEVYADYSPSGAGGEPGLKRLSELTEAYGIPSQTPQVTHYTYVNDPSNAAVHGRLASIIHPDGSWNAFEYDISASSVAPVITEYSSWKDVSIANKSQARKTETVVEGGAFTVTTKVNDVVISQSTTTLAISNGEIRTTTSHWDRASTLSGAEAHTTITAYHLDTASAPSTGRIKWIENSDGTAIIYTYAIVANKLVITTRSGAGDHNGVTAGTEVKSTLGVGFIPIEQTTTDLSSSIITESWVTDTSGNMDFDAIGRPIKRIFNGDVDDYDNTKYACCGLEEVRKRDGSTTKYYRDPLKRVWKVETKATPNAPAVATITAVDGFTTTQTRTIGGQSLFLGSTTRSFDGLTHTSTAPSQKSTVTTDRPVTTSVTDHTTHQITTTYDDGSQSITETYLSGQTKSVTGTAVADVSYDYATHSENFNGLATTTTASGISTTTYTDFLGRTSKEVSPATGTTQYSYHPVAATAGSRGKLQSITDADGVTVTYGYSSEGERSTTSRSVPIATGTATQVTTTGHDVVAEVTLHGNTFDNFHRQYQQVSSTGVAAITTSESFTSIDGLISGSRSFGKETLTVATRPNATSGIATTTTTHPDGSKTVQTITHGLLTKTEQVSSGANPSVIASTTRTYDTLQRPLTVIDSRNTNTITYGVINATTADVTESGQPLKITASNGTATVFTYDKMGRLTATDAPNTIIAGVSSENITRSSYHLTGQLKARWGDLTYATFYKYDEQNRMTKLHTYRSLAHNTEPVEDPSGADITKWNYDPATGLLSGKRDEADKGPDYTYTTAGRLKTRKWARGLWTRYDYAHGFLTATRHFTSATSYATVIAAATASGNDPATPDSDTTFDALGRPEITSTFTMLSGSRVEFTRNKLFYTANLTIDKEDITVDPDGSGSIPALFRTLDRNEEVAIPLRPTGWDLKNGTAVEHSNTYGYHTTEERLATVSGSGTGDFTYGYVANSNLIASVTNSTVSNTLAISNSWLPNLDVLEKKENKVGVPDISKYVYEVNELNQRSGVSTSGSAFGATESVSWGYDVLGQVVTADHSLTTAAKDFGYIYDKMGNRKRSSRNTTDPATATGVNLAVYRKQNSVGSEEGGNNLNQYKRLELYGAAAVNNTYDDDGNQEEGRFPNATMAAGSRIWDGENQLIQTTVTDGATTIYTYDAFHRRVAERTSATNFTISLYDGFNPIAEYNMPSSSFVLQTTYTWGLDLSNTLQGAGGVGGLLAVQFHTGTNAGIYCPTFDGNGNVSEYINSSNGTVVAHYEYGPFGELTVAGEDMAAAFKHRFSTKPFDVSTGYYYYLYRYYDPVTGRWPSRDPIGERGGVNLYYMAKNCPSGLVDYLGLDPTVPGSTSIDDSWDSLQSNSIRNTAINSSILNAQSRPDVTKRLKDNCPCDQNKIMEGYFELIDIWTEKWVELEFLESGGERVFLPLGSESKEQENSCITLNTKVLAFLQNSLPKCWTCKLEHGIRIMDRGEKGGNTIFRGTADHWWVSCSGMDDSGDIVKEAAFDAWRNTRDVWGGMNPSVNRSRYPYTDQNQIFDW